MLVCTRASALMLGSWFELVRTLRSQSTVSPSKLAAILVAWAVPVLVMPPALQSGRVQLRRPGPDGGPGDQPLSPRSEHARKRPVPPPGRSAVAPCPRTLRAGVGAPLGVDRAAGRPRPPGFGDRLPPGRPGRRGPHGLGRTRPGRVGGPGPVGGLRPGRPQSARTPGVGGRGPQRRPHARPAGGGLCPGPPGPRSRRPVAVRPGRRGEGPRPHRRGFHRMVVERRRLELDETDPPVVAAVAWPRRPWPPSARWPVCGWRWLDGLSNPGVVVSWLDPATAVGPGPRAPGPGYGGPAAGLCRPPDGWGWWAAGAVGRPDGARGAGPAR